MMKTKRKQFSIAEIYRRRDIIDLDPFFQREKVWNVRGKQLLIDSILKEWGIPKVYLAISKSSGGREVFQCIDGKQRLTSIYEFLGGRFPLGNVSEGQKGKFYSQLPPKGKDKLNDYRIDIEEASGFTEDELSELFRRLQLGSALSSGEKLNATIGNMKKFASKLTRHRLFRESVSFPDRRHAFLAVCGQMCVLELKGIRNLKLKDLESFFREYSGFNTRSLEAKKITNTLDYLAKTFGRNSSWLSNRANITSTYFFVSQILQRTSLVGKQKLLFKFFKGFEKRLHQVIDGRSKAGDAEFLRYQNAVTQAADSSTSIRIRHEILLKQIVNFDLFFKKAINVSTEEEDFLNLYNTLLSKEARGNLGIFEKKLLRKFPNIKIIRCRRKETIPLHVRHSLHHIDHPRHTRSQVGYSLNILKQY